MLIHPQGPQWASHPGGFLVDGPSPCTTPGEYMGHRQSSYHDTSYSGGGRHSQGLDARALPRTGRYRNVLPNPADGHRMWVVG